MYPKIIFFLFCFSLFSIHSGLAREPGIAPSIPPGLTLGIPIAINPPPGVYFISRTAYSDFTLYDNAGKNNGQTADIWTESLQLTWVPGWTLLGGSYKSFLMIPFARVSMERTTTATGRPGSWSSFGMANPEIQPLDLSWNLGNGWHIGTGLGIYLPIGKNDSTAEINIAGNFWTLEPSLGITWMNNPWHFATHVIYNTNTRNPDTKYRSGDQVFINSTLTYRLRDWNVGPVAYFQRQITHDKNDGGPASYGGNVFPKQEQAGAGVLVGRNIGEVNLFAMFTRDIYAHNTMGGNKIWFNFMLPLDI